MLKFLQILSIIPTLFLCSLMISAEDPPPAGHDAGSLTLPRVSGEIKIDGIISDPGWKKAAKITTFYEVSPGDNNKPPVSTTAWIAYDAEYFYAAFHCEDPDPSSIRAPYTERDGLSSAQDFAGFFLDVKNSRLTSLELFVNPRGIQSDGIKNDATGREDFSPDFFWDAAAEITADGWNAELRVPMSSLRYSNTDPQSWGIILLRNYPREQRYQISNVVLPRGSNCLLCHELELTAITGLSGDGKLIVAPYLTGHERGYSRGVPGASGMLNSPASLDGGLDLKWTPNANTVVDLTLNPDFSQIESDTVQVSENQRFALFYSEKRPFFMEGVQLFQTPISAVYTRTITDPAWGARVTGEQGSSSYTFLLAHDRGGGSIVLPGVQYSRLLPQDFESDVSIGRYRKDFGRSYIGCLVTGRQNNGHGSNFVFGPDFQWNPNDKNQFTGQYLASSTRTPDRPGLDPSWDGESRSSGALSLAWRYSTKNWNAGTDYTDIGNDFRTQTGFVPQVGYREIHQWLGYAWYTEDSFFTRVEPYVNVNESWQHSGGTLTSRWAAGTDVQAKYNLYGDLTFVRWIHRVGNNLFHYHNTNFTCNFSPGIHLTQISIYGDIGQQVDYDNNRPGRGGTLQYGFTLKPFDRLTFMATGEHDWLNVNSEQGTRGRLYTADVARLKTLLSISAKSYFRLIFQWVNTDRNPSLYKFPVSRRNSELQSSLLYSYRLNWQSIIYAGYSDERPYIPGAGIRLAERRIFFKLSYAFQR